MTDKISGGGGSTTNTGHTDSHVHPDSPSARPISADNDHDHDDGSVHHDTQARGDGDDDNNDDDAGVVQNLSVEERLQQAGGVSPTITQQWRDTIESLLQRKFLYHLGPRGGLHILSKCIFYIAKLRHICSLTPEEKQTVKSKLRKDLALRKNFPRLSFAVTFHPANKNSEQECLKLSKQNRHGYISSVLRFPQLGDFHKIADWKNFTLEQLCQNDILLSISFHHLCYLYNEQVSIKNFDCAFVQCGPFRLYLAHGRRQKDLLHGAQYMPQFRIIKKDSIFLSSCLLAAHVHSFGRSHFQMKYFIYSLNILCVDLERSINAFQKECYACKLEVAAMDLKIHKLQVTNPSPTSRMLSSLNLSSAFQCISVDLSGKMSYLDYDNIVRPVYVLVAVSDHLFGSTIFVALPDKTTTSVVTALTTLAYRCATRIKIFQSDAGTEWRQYTTKTSDMLPSEDPHATNWFSSLLQKDVKSHLNSLGIEIDSQWIQYGKARQQSNSISELKIKELKKSLKSFKIFSKNNFPCNIFQLQSLLHLTENILESHPVITVDNKVYSLGALKNLMFSSGAEIGGFPPTNSVAAQKVVRQLQDSHREIISCLLNYNLKFLQLEKSKDEHSKIRESTQALSLNSVVFDSISYLESGNISGSLGRVVQLGKSKNFCLIARCLNTDHDKARVVTVQRPTNALTPIVIQDCNQPAPNDPLFVLPPFELERSKYNMLPCELGAHNPPCASCPQIPDNILTPGDKSTSPEPVSHQSFKLPNKTRAGRQVRRPARLGVNVPNN